MSNDHIEALDKKITALSEALARLGHGTTQAELLRLIRFPGWTTPAEIAFLNALLNATQSHVSAIETLQGEMLSACKAVGRQ